MKHGLVIGKFYPPHAGHHLLVRAAAAACGRVSVIVMAAGGESIPLWQRMAWLREEHRDAPHVSVTGIEDNVPVDYDDPLAWHQHVELMRLALRRIAAPRVTAVFTSEPYGPELARRFDATPVSVDPDRRIEPVSGTDIRKDPRAHWKYLSPAVRTGLAVRVVVVGAESSGTTTLSRTLAGHFGAAWVPEYGRAYTARKLAQCASGKMQDLCWSSGEFIHIAQEQLAAEDKAAGTGGSLLVCDTDAFATAIWHERYMGRKSPEVMRIADGARHAMYFVTDHDGVPFEQDGLRDGESIRSWMTQRFLAMLAESGRPHLLLSGSRDARMRRAIDETERILSRAWTFG